MNNDEKFKEFFGLTAGSDAEKYVDDRSDSVSGIVNQYRTKKASRGIAPFY
jgi:hypothetical protein